MYVIYRPPPQGRPAPHFGNHCFNMLTAFRYDLFSANNICNSPVCLENTSKNFVISHKSYPHPHVCALLSCYPDAKDNSFTRSRSSSVTSIDRESREAISSFHFCESFPRKTDSLVSPCLLVGTTQGAVMMVALSLPAGGDHRPQQPVGISSCGKMLKWNSPHGDSEKTSN